MSCLIVTLLAASSLQARGSPLTQVAPLTASDLVARMAASDRQRAAALSGYRSTRVYEVDYSGFPSGRHAKMVATVSYQAPGKKSFTIVSEEGSKLLLNRVLHRLLESEQEATDDVNREQSALTDKNYDFELLGRDVVEGRACYVLGVKAKRDNKFLYDGRIWTDAQDFAVARIEAQPAKNPSFWISQTNVEHHYLKRGEFWLPARNRSSSKLRMGGRAVLTIDYGSYEMINGQDARESRAETSRELR
jgi:outer membrane lipoprotein-sorting protein